MPPYKSAKPLSMSEDVHRTMTTLAGRIIGDSSGFWKLLFRHKDLKLLGVHAIEKQATKAGALAQNVH